MKRGYSLGWLHRLVATRTVGCALLHKHILPKSFFVFARFDGVCRAFTWKVPAQTFDLTRISWDEPAPDLRGWEVEL